MNKWQVIELIHDKVCKNNHFDGQFIYSLLLHNEQKENSSNKQRTSKQAVLESSPLKNSADWYYPK